MIIKALTTKDSHLFEDAVELLNRTQGKGIFPQNYIQAITTSPWAQAFGSFIDGKLIGVGVAEIINTFDFYIPFDPNITNELKNRVVGSFSTLAVEEKYQGQGIGKKISIERFRWLTERGCTTILGVSWASGLKNTSDRVFEKMGFTAVKTVEHFFKDMSIERNFLCPACKVIPCRCAGILYRWDQKT